MLPVLGIVVAVCLLAVTVSAAIQSADSADTQTENTKVGNTELADTKLWDTESNNETAAWLLPFVSTNTAGENVTVGLEYGGVPNQGLNDTRVPFEVVVEGATAGINATDITIDINKSMSDPDATFTDYELNKTWLDNTHKTDENTTINLEVALGDNTHPPGEEITVATVWVTATGTGELAVEPVSANVVGSVDYNQSLLGPESVPIVEPPELVGQDNPPQDLTGDQLLEDVTGDGSVGLQDVSTLFLQRNEIDEEQAKFFSFGESTDDIDSVDLSNVASLFLQRDTRDPSKFRLDFLSQQFEGEFEDGEVNVTVEDIASDESEDTTLIVTYEDDEDDVIAGLTTVEVESSAETVTLTDLGGFEGQNPVGGEHAAHLIPTDELSQEYEVGDVVSPETADDFAATDTALVTGPINSEIHALGAAPPN